ncbi:MAG TPA: DNA polymerase III subunit chi [Steroidobacteraceae bacterium]|nr:DNA polymerase III subunit chi [Steroidobacteraceae bacterium]
MEAEGLATQPSVTFYVVADPSPTAQLSVACRIVEKAWKAGSTVLVQHHDAAELARLDEMLWVGNEQNFIPHEIATTAPSITTTPVILNGGTGPTAPVDVLINLTPQLPGRPELAGRIIEIIDTDPARRAAGRERFRAYRERGFALEKHDL